jgi:hypothetical protein
LWLYFLGKIIYDFSQMFFRKRKLQQNIPFRKRMLPSGDFSPKSQRLAPSIIGKQIFGFLISGSADIRLINK